MNEKTKNAGQSLYKTLLKQNDILDTIILRQKLVRVAVTNKNWQELQESMNIINTLADEFLKSEKKRIDLCLKLHPNKIDDIYAISDIVPVEFKKPILENFYQMKQKLLVSKVENSAINEYIRITQEFLQGIFDKVLPQRRNKLYASDGSVVNNQPKSIVLDTTI
ncbi:MAG: hypothetical protein R3Y36_04580 [Spirochaetales bacterium]